MEDQPKITRKSIMLNYGLLLGFISIIIALLNYVFGDIYKPHWGLIVVSIGSTIVVIILAIRKLKELQEGILSLGDAIKTGLGIALISALLYSLYLLIFFNLIEPTFFENMAKVQEVAIAEQYPNLTDEQLETALKNTAMFNNASVNLTLTVIFSLFFGLIISLIGGLIMKKTEDL